ncbi:MAG: hypothetical protein L0Z70_03440 [Chloroflexi bacterium]|nr:hypothetical protein [Chloroflexota bacterium]
MNGRTPYPVIHNEKPFLLPPVILLEVAQDAKLRRRGVVPEPPPLAVKVVTEEIEALKTYLSPWLPAAELGMGLNAALMLNAWADHSGRSGLWEPGAGLGGVLLLLFLSAAAIGFLLDGCYRLVANVEARRDIHAFYARWPSFPLTCPHCKQMIRMSRRLYEYQCYRCKQVIDVRAALDGSARSPLALLDDGLLCPLCGFVTPLAVRPVWFTCHICKARIELNRPPGIADR